MRKITLLFVLLISFVIVFTACDDENTAGNNNPAQENESTETAAENNDTSEPVVVDPEDISAYNQAPDLAALVESGDLPPVEERLPIPEDIMVEPVYEEIGQYGGDMTVAWGGFNDRWSIGAIIEEGLFRFNKDASRVEPNVAKGFDVNEDSTEFTIHLREGMRWSDGIPFTADDILFYWEHMLTKETFGKKVYDAYYSVDPATNERHVATLEKIDDYTIKFTHAFPNVMFMERVAIDNKWFWAPGGKHFQETILPEFIGEEKSLEIAKEWGFNDVAGFLKATGYYFWVHPEIPTLRPWVASNDPNSESFILKRNPYYWKVDAEGNQLPYINNVIAKKLPEESQKMLDTLGGNIDLINFNFKDFTVLKENEKKGGYEVLEWNSVEWSSTGIALNLTVDDSNLNPIFNDIRFREALSIAVDRNEISEIITDGLGVPQQASVPEGLIGYSEEWANKWIEYDAERANQLLDEIGLSERNSDNYRLFADGSVVNLTFYDQDGINAKLIELLTKYFGEIGIQVDLKIVDQATMQEYEYSNKVPIQANTISLLNLALRPDAIIPLRNGMSIAFGANGLYTESGGEEGIAPEGDVTKILEYWNNVKSSLTTDDVIEWSKEILKVHQEDIYNIGYTGPTPILLIKNKDLMNVPEGLVHSDETRYVGHGHPMQFYFKQ